MCTIFVFYPSNSKYTFVFLILHILILFSNIHEQVFSVGVVCNCRYMPNNGIPRHIVSQSLVSSETSTR